MLAVLVVLPMVREAKPVVVLLKSYALANASPAERITKLPEPLKPLVVMLAVLFSNTKLPPLITVAPV